MVPDEPTQKNTMAMNIIEDAAVRNAAFHNVYIDETDVGLGVFAARRLNPVNWILTFEGPRVASNHPLVANDEMGNLLQVDDDVYLIPKPPGVLVNHSCRPNAGIVNGIHLVAIRQIQAGEEIRFDYSTTMKEDDWTLECQCGASSCREYIRDFDDLPADVRQKYLDMGIVAPFIARQY